MGSIDEKDQRSKISCYCPFNQSKELLKSIQRNLNNVKGEIFNRKFKASKLPTWPAPSTLVSFRPLGGRHSLAISLDSNLPLDVLSGVGRGTTLAHTALATACCFATSEGRIRGSEHSHFPAFPARGHTLHASEYPQNALFANTGAEVPMCMLPAH